MGERNRYGRVIATRVPDSLARDVETLAALRGISRSELLSALAQKEINMTLSEQIEAAEAAVDALQAGDAEAAAEILQALIKTAKPAPKPEPVEEAHAILRRVVTTLSAQAPAETKLSKTVRAFAEQIKDPADRARFVTARANAGKPQRRTK